METVEKLLGLTDEQAAAFAAAREKGEALEAAQLLLASLAGLLKEARGHSGLDKKLSELERALQNARQVSVFSSSRVCLTRDRRGRLRRWCWRCIPRWRRPRATGARGKRAPRWPLWRSRRPFSTSCRRA
jgi:hypothetical protein